MNEDCGEIPVAFVVKKKGSSLSQEAIMDYVSGQVCSYLFEVFTCDKRLLNLFKISVCFGRLHHTRRSERWFLHL